MQSLRLKLGAVHYTVRPDTRLVLQIEQELGALPLLAENFHTARWHFSELVSLLHMLLQHSGKTLDYMTLGDLVLQNGITECHRTALRFFTLLNLPLQDPENPASQKEL